MTAPEFGPPVPDTTTGFCQPAIPERWHVVDYDDRPLPGTWPTEAEADEALMGQYLLSGMAVRRGPGAPVERS